MKGCSSEKMLQLQHREEREKDEEEISVDCESVGDEFYYD